MHNHHGRYLEAVTHGGARYRLDGTEDGDITDHQRQHAADTLAARLQYAGIALLAGGQL
jgi:ProP effector